MTWYADEVIAPATPEVIRSVKTDPLLADFAYHLLDPFEHTWHTPEIIHGLPAGGLLVVRPVCDASPDESPADWYGEPVLDWHSFPSGCNPPPLVDRGRVVESAALHPDVVPPEGLLSYLNALAIKTGCPFVFYSCFMWGGDPEREYAWVLGNSEVVFASVESESPEEPRAVAILEPFKSAQLVTGDTLAFALARIGLELPTPYFAPHTREFPWEKYRLTRAPA